MKCGEDSDKMDRRMSRNRQLRTLKWIIGLRSRDRDFSFHEVGIKKTSLKEDQEILPCTTN